MLNYLKKIDRVEKGIVQVVCHEAQYASHLSNLASICPAETITEVANDNDYSRLMMLVQESKDRTILVTRFLQKVPGIIDCTGAHPLYKSQVVKALVTECERNNVKIVSLCVVRNGYEFSYDTIMREIKPVCELASFVTKHLAFLAGDDSIVLRDGDYKCPIETSMIERARQIARDNPIDVITAREIKHPNTVIIGDAGAGMKATQHLLNRMESEVILTGDRVADGEGILNLTVPKRRLADNGTIPLKVNHELGTVSTELPNGEEVVLTKAGPYESKRGMMLLCQTPSDKPILTAENYGKWYDLYVLFPDGTVQGLHDLGVDMYDVPKLKVDCPRIDHNYHPELFRRLANANDWYIHDVAMEVAAGRWAVEYHKQFDDVTYYRDHPEEESE